MKTRTIAWIAAALVAVLSTGTVAAHPGQGLPNGLTFEEVCPDDITVGECKANIQDYRYDAIVERCSEHYDEAFCEELIDLRIEQKNETKALFEENGYNATPHPFNPDRADWPKPRDVCDGNTTINECRELVQEARREALLAACADEYDEEFCQELIDLKQEHKGEIVALFDEYGYELPDRQQVREDRIQERKERFRQFLELFKERWGRQ